MNNTRFLRIGLIAALVVGFASTLALPVWGQFPFPVAHYAAAGSGGGSGSDAGCCGTNYNGSDEYLTDSTPFSGSAISTKTFIYAGSVRRTNAGAGNQVLLEIRSNAFGRRWQLRFDTVDRLVIVGENASDNVVLNAATNITIDDTGWHRILMAVDLTDSDNTQVWIDDVKATLSLSTHTDDFMHLPGSNASVVSYSVARTDTSSFSLYFSGDRSETYLNFDEWLDFDVEANRRLFETAAGLPEDIGADGSTPTGTQPEIYMPNGVTNVGTWSLWDTTGGNPTAVQGPNP